MKRVILFFSVGAALLAADAQTDAIDAIRALKSATNAGVTLRDYQQRVVDARVTVDKFLATPATDDKALRDAMQAALASYQLAGRAWSAKLIPYGVEKVRAWRNLQPDVDAEAKTCPALAEALAVADKQPLFQSDHGHAQFITTRLSLIWRCGEAHFADAEKLVKKTE